MNWIWPGNDMPLEELAEDTALQKSVKKHLLSGGRIGSGYGEYSGRK